MDGTKSGDSEVSSEELKLFYAIDRDLYRILVTDLCRNPAESMHIMALWLWLERVGLCNIVGKILSLAPSLINRLADEATICLNVISNNQFQISTSTLEIPLTSALINPPESFSLGYLHENRCSVHDAVLSLVSEVCIPALSDVVGGVEDDAADPFAGGGCGGSRASRTMFATFSKGYPVSEEEVREFFGRRFGDCIESLRMQEVRCDKREQALYARIVFIRSSMIGMILKGGDKAKFSINGKHVWMRQFVPRRSSFCAGNK